MRCPSFEDLPSAPEGKTGWPWTEPEPLPPLMSEGNPGPRISIITPSYNQGQYIEETIRSVLLQGYPDLEYIIIDGCSTDDSVEIIKKYEPWLSYWVSEPDGGQAHALNKGFARSTGDILAYINSDDLYASGIFHTVAQLFHSRTKPFWAAFSLVVFNGDGFHRLWEVGYFHSLYHWIYGEGMIPQPSVFWGRRLYEDVGGFDEDMHFAFDKDFFLRLVLRNYTYTAYPEVIGSFFRLHSDSKTCSGQERFQADTETMRRKAEALLTREQRKALDRQIRHNSVVNMIKASWQDEQLTLGDSVYALLGSIRIEPSIISNRFFWGGVKRVLKKRLRTHEA
jgi:glycosyltransferase involved in cell wall biosynthesis